MRSYLHFRQRARDPGRAVWLGGQRGQVDGRGGHDGARAVRVRGADQVGRGRPRDGGDQSPIELRRRHLVEKRNRNGQIKRL